VLERDIGLRTFIESGVTWKHASPAIFCCPFLRRGCPARRRRDCAEGSRGGGSLLPAVNHRPGTGARLGDAPPRGHRITEETIALHRGFRGDGRISVGAFGELVQGLSLAEVRERINRHFEARHPGSIRIDESPPIFRWLRPAFRPRRRVESGGDAALRTGEPAMKWGKRLLGW